MQAYTVFIHSVEGCLDVDIKPGITPTIVPLRYDERYRPGGEALVTDDEKSAVKYKCIKGKTIAGIRLGRFDNRATAGSRARVRYIRTFNGEIGKTYQGINLVVGSGSHAGTCVGHMLIDENSCPQDRDKSCFYITASGNTCLFLDTYGTEDLQSLYAGVTYASPDSRRPDLMTYNILCTISKDKHLILHAYDIDSDICWRIRIFYNYHKQHYQVHQIAVTGIKRDKLVNRFLLKRKTDVA